MTSHAINDTRPQALVVEDDMPIGRLLQYILEREGFAVTLAVDGREGVQQIQTMAPAALMILDVMLPFQNGYELLQTARATSGWQEVPIIMLSAKSQDADIARAFDAGANDYLVKPFQPNELKARIKRLVRK